MLKIRNMISCSELKMDSGEETNSPQVRSSRTGTLSLWRTGCSRECSWFSSPDKTIYYFHHLPSFCHIKDGVDVSEPHTSQVFMPGKLTENSVSFSAVTFNSNSELITNTISVFFMSSWVSVPCSRGLVSIRLR